jgi:hypothetical protein
MKDLSRTLQGLQMAPPNKSETKTKNNNTVRRHQKPPPNKRIVQSELTTLKVQMPSPTKTKMILKQGLFL